MSWIKLGGTLLSFVMLLFRGGKWIVNWFREQRIKRLERDYHQSRVDLGIERTVDTSQEAVDEVHKVIRGEDEDGKPTLTFDRYNRNGRVRRDQD